MDFDWNNPSFGGAGSLTVTEIEESFEDPFSVRLLPDSPRFSAQARYFNLGRSAAGVGLFFLGLLPVQRQGLAIGGAEVKLTQRCKG